MARYTPPALVGPSKMALWEPSLGRLELGNLPYSVDSFQIGSPDIRDNIKNRALLDGVFDDTMYHGASAITVTTRLAPHARCNSRLADYWFSTLRDQLVSYMHPRLRPRLYWRFPGDEGPLPGVRPGVVEGAGQWAEVRGASWPFIINGPKYPGLTVQFKNPLGQIFLGDPQDPPHTVTAFPGAEAAGRLYDLVFDRDYPNIDVPVGTAIIYNNGNSPAGFRLQVKGPFDDGATVVLRGVTIRFAQGLLTNQYVELRTLNKTILRENGNSYYPFTNFGEWDWEDLLLPHTEPSLMSFDSANLGAPSGWATIEWHSTSI
jgi:hypothetical protein